MASHDKPVRRVTRSGYSTQTAPADLRAVRDEALAQGIDPVALRRDAINRWGVEPPTATATVATTRDEAGRTPTPMGIPGANSSYDPASRAAGISASLHGSGALRSARVESGLESSKSLPSQAMSWVIRFAVVIGCIVLGFILLSLVSMDTNGVSQRNHKSPVINDFTTAALTKYLNTYTAKHKSRDSKPALRAPGTLYSSDLAFRQGLSALRMALVQCIDNGLRTPSYNRAPPSLLMAIQGTDASASHAEIMRRVRDFFDGMSSHHIRSHVLDVNSVYAAAKRAADSITHVYDGDAEETEESLAAKQESTWISTGRRNIYDEINKFVSNTRKTGGELVVPVVLVPLLGTYPARLDNPASHTSHAFSPNFYHLQAFQELADDYIAPWHTVLYVYIVDGRNLVESENGLRPADLRELTAKYLAGPPTASNQPRGPDVDSLTDRLCRNMIVMNV